MKNTFTSDSFQIDLSSVQLSIQEENSFFKDGFFTKFTFPFSIDITPKIRISLGDHSHLNAAEMTTRFDGWFHFEGNLYQAQLHILSVQENTMQVQIDYGFDELPEMNSKLSDISFSEYAHITQTQHQDYRFPTLYYDRFRNADYFDGFSHRINARNDNGSFVENDYSYSGNDYNAALAKAKIRNQNYVQPMPYLLSVLKQIAQNLGLTLSGDILNDALLRNQLIYKPMKPYTYNDQQEYNFEVDTSANAPTIQTFELELNPGEYEFSGQGRHSSYFSAVSIKHIESDKGVDFFNYETGPAALRFLIKEQHQNKKYMLIADKNKISPTSAHISIVPSRNDYKSIDYNLPAYPLIVKIERWDIRSLLPDMTIGELFNLLKSLFSYYIKIEGKNLFVNKIKSDISEAKAMQHSAVKFPNIIYPEREKHTYFFSEVKGYELPAIVFNHKEVITKHLPKNEQSQENETEWKFYSLPYVAPTMQKSVGEDESVLIFVNANLHEPYTPSQFDSRYAQGFHSGDFAQEMKNNQFKFLTNKQIEWSVIDKRVHWQD